MKQMKWVGILVLILICLNHVSCSKKIEKNEKEQVREETQQIQYDKQVVAWRLINRHDDLFDQYCLTRQESRVKDREEARARLFAVTHGLRTWNSTLSEEEKWAFYETPVVHANLYEKYLRRTDGGVNPPGYLTLQIYNHVAHSRATAEKLACEKLDDKELHELLYRISSRAMREALEHYALADSYCNSILEGGFKILDQKAVIQLIEHEWNSLKQNGLVPTDAQPPFPTSIGPPRRAAFYYFKKTVS